MGNIERKFWLTRAPKGDTGWLVTTEHEHYRRVLEWPVEGPFVPASQLQGAVGEIEALRHWIDVAARNCPANGEVDAILVESRRRVPPAGGQYEAAPPKKDAK